MATSTFFSCVFTCFYSLKVCNNCQQFPAHGMQISSIILHTHRSGSYSQSDQFKQICLLKSSSSGNHFRRREPAAFTVVAEGLVATHLSSWPLSSWILLRNLQKDLARSTKIVY